MRIPDNVSLLLERAAGQIEALGWVQGNPRGRRGEVSADVALRRARANLGLSFVALEEAHNRLAAYIGTRDIISWNDRPGRTAREVIATLRNAAGIP
jgi:hypothetical protein